LNESLADIGLGDDNEHIIDNDKHYNDDIIDDKVNKLQNILGEFVSD